MPELVLKNTLAVHSFVYSTMKKIELKVKEIPMWESKKGDHELLKAVCKFMIEELDLAVNDSTAPIKLSSDQANKIDKTKLVIEALSNVYGLSEEEQLALETGVEFLLNNKVLKNKKIRRSFVSLGNKLISKVFFLKK